MNITVDTEPHKTACRLLCRYPMEQLEKPLRSSRAAVPQSDERQRGSGVEMEAPETGLPAAPAPPPNMAQLVADERFWREAIATWQSLLLSKRRSETLRYLKSCQEKLAEVLALLGKVDEAAQQNQAVLETTRLLQAATIRASGPSNKWAALLVCIALMSGTLVLLLSHRTSHPSAPAEGFLQKNQVEASIAVLSE